MAGFYDLSKTQRESLVNKIKEELRKDLYSGGSKYILKYFADDDTYIRKSAYLQIGKIYFENEILQSKILVQINLLLENNEFKVRQTSINAAGEIGKKYFEIVQNIFDKGLFDSHHAPRNAVIGSIKKMGEVNPKPVLRWAKKYLHHPDKEIRREICHGIELRGRKHPEEILPLLKELQFDKTSRVRKTLVHVLGQIAYKKGCLGNVIAQIKNWENQELVIDAIQEIIDVHHRYGNFAAMTQKEAKKYIDDNFS